MWNTDFTVPTLILLILITVAFFVRNRLPIRLNRVFAGLLATDFLTMATDYAATYMDEMPGVFPDAALWFVNYLFFGFFIARSYYFFCFTLEQVDLRKHGRAKRLFEMLFIAEQAFLLVGSLAGWIFSIGEGDYASGPLYQFINIQFAAWVICAFVIAARAPRAIGTRRAGIYLYLAILLCGIVSRILMPEVVVMNLYCFFAIQVIYLFYLNPDQYIDDITLLFNDRGWNRMLDEASIQPEFGMVGFAIRDFAGFRKLRGIQNVCEGLDRIGLWIRHEWPDLSAFYLGDGIFTLASARPFDQQAVLDSIERRFAEPWHAESGGYYLSVNEIVMAPGVAAAHADHEEQLRGTMRDAYHVLNQPGTMELVRIDDALIGKHLHNLEVQKILQDALTRDSLEMFLQPIVNTATGKVEGAEALCRLPDGKGGYVFPDEFIPLAMDNGDMNVLGHQMFRKACAFMSRADVRESGLCWVNVNVAPEQFKNPNLMDDFLGTLARYRLGPSQVHLEITEETMIDRALLHDSMTRFRAHGFVFSMDDFGSSYSNMIRLQQNHFSCVKIDRDFTWSYFKKQTPLLPDIIKTCHDLGMEVVIEGVETREMVDGVKEIGADFIQGYYYSKPIPAVEFAEKFVRADGEGAADGADDRTDGRDAVPDAGTPDALAPGASGAGASGDVEEAGGNEAGGNVAGDGVAPSGALHGNDGGSAVRDASDAAAR